MKRSDTQSSYQTAYDCESFQSAEELSESLSPKESPRQAINDSNDSNSAPKHESHKLDESKPKSPLAV